jgi:hypothetical protein
MHLKDSRRHTFLPEFLVYVLNAKASIQKSNWQKESHETNLKRYRIWKKRLENKRGFFDISRAEPVFFRFWGYRIFKADRKRRDRLPKIMVMSILQIFHTLRFPYNFRLMGA